MPATHFETGGIDPGSVKGKIVKVIGRLGDDHGRAEAREVFPGVSDLRYAIGACGSHAQELVVGAIGNDINSRDGGGVLNRIGEYQYLFASLPGDQADIRKRNEPAVLYPIIRRGTDHEVVNALEFGHFIGDIEIEQPV